MLLEARGAGEEMKKAKAEVVPLALELEVEEREEVRRILAALTETVRQEQKPLREDWEHLGWVDALRARALLAIRLGAEVPVFSET